MNCRSSEAYCGKLLSSSGTFASCKLNIDLTLYYQSCVFDMCATEGSMEIFIAVSFISTFTFIAFYFCFIYNNINICCFCCFIKHVIKNEYTLNYTLWFINKGGS